MINRQFAVSVNSKKTSNPNPDLFLSNRELYQNSLLQHRNLQKPQCFLRYSYSSRYCSFSIYLCNVLKPLLLIPCSLIRDEGGGGEHGSQPVFFTAPWTTGAIRIHRTELLLLISGNTSHSACAHSLAHPHGHSEPGGQSTSLEANPSLGHRLEPFHRSSCGTSPGLKKLPTFSSSLCAFLYIVLCTPLCRAARRM